MGLRGEEDVMPDTIAVSADAARDFLDRHGPEGRGWYTVFCKAGGGQ